MPNKVLINIVKIKPHNKVYNELKNKNINEIYLSY